MLFLNPISSRLKYLLLAFLLIFSLTSFHDSYAQNNDSCSVFSVYDSSPIQRRLDNLCKNRLKFLDKSSSNTDEKEKNAVIISMIDQQMNAAESFLDIRKRVNQLNIKDNRKPLSRDSLANAEPILSAFIALNVDQSPDLLDEDPFRPSSEFNNQYKKAKIALNKVNRALIAPIRPGVTKTKGGDLGGVPEGDLIDDFVPGLIKLLFRFTSLIIFISFLVSGVMYITAFGNEDSLTKAKNILYYSLIGFAIVTLAFAIVQAITDIDFFGFI